MNALHQVKSEAADEYIRSNSVTRTNESLCRKAQNFGHSKALKSPVESFGLAVFAGMFIAMAFVFYVTVTTGSTMDWGISRFIGGLAFSLGLILVVICGGELFTSTVLSTIAWAEKKLSSTALLACWSRVYIGNFIGALFMLLLVFGAKMYMLNNGLWGANLLALADHKLHHDWMQAFVLGILCNMMVCLGIWMTLSSKDTLTKALLVMLPVAMFVSSGFEHSIANLFLVPLAIVIQHFAPESFFEVAGITVEQYAGLTASNFIFNNLIPVTLGNIVGGGVVVALGYLMIERHGKHQDKAMSHKNHIGQANVHLAYPEEGSPSTTEIPTESNQIASTVVIPLKPLFSSRTITESQLMPHSIISKNVSELMDTQPLTLSPAMTVQAGLKCLVDNNKRSAPVIDDKQHLVGFVTEQDLMRSLWSDEFSSQQMHYVQDIMQKQVLTVSGDDKVADLVEMMVVDREKLYPSTQAGIYAGANFASYDERLRMSHARKPSCFPVVDAGVLRGVISREAIAAKLSSVIN
ncbi:formate transporter FocA [Shewanella maritima]|uniref:formate transporter FocA n=1 Tax=Shewanella maritima TaxID=2520507 RepID=UPI0037354150